MKSYELRKENSCYTVSLQSIETLAQKSAEHDCVLKTLQGRVLVFSKLYIWGYVREDVFSSVAQCDVKYLANKNHVCPLTNCSCREIYFAASSLTDIFCCSYVDSMSETLIMVFIYYESLNIPKPSLNQITGISQGKHQV